jgi:hypothetical protein
VTAPVQYGTRIAAFVLYLLHYQLLPDADRRGRRHRGSRKQWRKEQTIQYQGNGMC